MDVIRPVTLDDLESLYALSEEATYGLTTLPHDRDLLAKRITGSLDGFSKLSESPRGEPYLFVLEDISTGNIIGTTGVVSKVGGFEPFYAYRIEESLHESKALKVKKTIGTLHLYTDHDGPSEIGTLFLAPESRGGGRGRLLSLIRFLFMAEFPKYFGKEVIAELRGFIDDEGRSPFWDALGKHFFDVDLATADVLSATNKRFIADLMPTHPIYIPLLPSEAQAVIGTVHEHTKPARKLLEGEGFRFNGMVDIFEAGPVLACKTSRVRAVHDSRKSKVTQIVDEPIDAVPCIVSNTERDFRGAMGKIQLDAAGGAIIERVLALALQVKVGEAIRFVAARSVEMEGGAS